MKNTFRREDDTIWIAVKAFGGPFSGQIIETAISAEDLDRVSAFSSAWRAVWQDKGHRYYVYVMTIKKRKRTAFHLGRLILNPPKGLVTDHIDHDSLNNRRSNLRAITHAQNQLNRAPGKAQAVVPYGGIFKQVNGRFGARVSKTIGTFDTREEAREALRKIAPKIYELFEIPGPEGNTYSSTVNRARV